jgi:hypothetical protein
MLLNKILIKMEENIEQLLNIFLKYYKKNFPEKHNKHFFDGINNYDDTNEIMEYFFQLINDYKTSINKTAIDYDKDRLEELEEKYILNIKNNPVKMSDNIISLLITIINNYDLTDDSNWEIIEM